MQIAATSPSFSRHPILVKEIKKSFPSVKLNSEGIRFKDEALLEYIREANALVVGLENIDENILKYCTNLEIIAKYGVGLNNLDLNACKARNIKIGWTGGVNRRSVSEMTLGFMLMLCRNLTVTSNLLANGIWHKSGGFQLSCKTVGIIGVGFVGKDVIRLLNPFGCRILVNDIIEQDEYYAENGLITATKEQIFKEADIISIHTPLTNKTENLINKQVLSLMSNSAFIINTARGGIINETDLKEALLSKTIGGAAIDSYVTEPPNDPGLLEIPNLITTPHIGGNSEEAVVAMGMSAIGHLRKYYNVE